MYLKHVLSVPTGDRTEISLPFSAVRGRDIVEAQDEYEALAGHPVSAVLELDKKFQAYVAAKIAQVPYDDILDLPVKDFAAITLAVQRFLLGRE
jgi:hypothetical protein